MDEQRMFHTEMTLIAKNHEIINSVILSVTINMVNYYRIIHTADFATFTISFNSPSPINTNTILEMTLSDFSSGFYVMFMPEKRVFFSTHVWVIETHKVSCFECMFLAKKRIVHSRISKRDFLSSFKTYFDFTVCSSSYPIFVHSIKNNRRTNTEFKGYFFNRKLFIPIQIFQQLFRNWNFCICHLHHLANVNIYFKEYNDFDRGKGSHHLADGVFPLSLSHSSWSWFE